jgi:hypothetical protein
MEDNVMNHHDTYSVCLNRRFVLTVLVSIAFVALLSACGQAETATRPNTVSATITSESMVPTAQPTVSVMIEGEDELVRVENGDGPPFYARFGENETFGNEEWVAVVFYRDPNCVPDEFNLNQFFDFPGETGPGAFGCQPPTTNVVEYWAGEPGSGPAPTVSEMSGRGAVPVWFFSRADIDSANSDGLVTITELEGLASRRVGSAATFTEYLKPSQSNAAPLLRFMAEGTLEGGGDFLVDVSYGDPDVADHTTIEIE